MSELPTIQVESPSPLPARRAATALWLRIFAILLMGLLAWNTLNIIEQVRGNPQSLFALLRFAAGLAWSIVPPILMIALSGRIARGDFAMLMLIMVMCLVLPLHELISALVPFLSTRWSIFLPLAFWPTVGLYLGAGLICLYLRQMVIRAPLGPVEFARASRAIGRARIAMLFIAIPIRLIGWLFVLAGLAMMIFFREEPQLGLIAWMVASPFVLVGETLGYVRRKYKDKDSARVATALCCLAFAMVGGDLIARTASFSMLTRFDIATAVLQRFPIVMVIWAMSELLHASRIAGVDPPTHSLGFEVISGDGIPMAQRKA